MIKFFYTITFIITVSTSFAQKDDVNIHTPEILKYTTELVVPELDIPWGMTFLPDGSMLVTEIKGKLIHFKDGVKTEIKQVPEVYARGQGGFMDVELHPDYKNNGWIYFTYSSTEGEENGGNTALMRAKIKEGTLVNKQILYKGTPNTTKPYHFGSRIVFDNDGFVYFGIGDRGEHFVNPQDITRDGGKIYRLKDDGTMPSDNPFVNEIGAKTAIYSYGHRNPQGMTKHPVTGQIWENEHGPQGGDEINIVRKGKNYGWPVICYGINYDNTILTEGQTYSISIAGHADNGYTEVFEVRIDYNNNGSFSDPGELVHSGSIAIGLMDTITGNFTVPTTAVKNSKACKPALKLIAKQKPFSTTIFCRNLAIFKKPIKSTFFKHLDEYWSPLGGFLRCVRSAATKSRMAQNKKGKCCKAKLKKAA